MPPSRPGQAIGASGTWTGALDAKTALRVAVGLLAAALALGVIVWAVDVTRLRDGVGILAARPWLLAAFLASYTAAFWLRGMAWRTLLPRLGGRAAFSILQSALFVNHVLPVKGGEIVRPYLATRRGIPALDSAATTLAARLLDYFSLLLIAAVLMWLTPGYPLGEAHGLALPAACLAAAAGGIWLVGFSSSLPSWTPGPLARAIGAARSALRGTAAGGRRQVALAAAWTLPSWLLEAGVLLVGAHALGVELTVPAAAAVTAFTILFQVFHFTPGGIGVYEASMTGALAAYGVAPDDALALAVLAHGLKFAYSYTVGLGFALFEGGSVIVRSRPGRAATEADEEDAPRPERKASRFEIVMARLWNVVNEGKPFTPVFAVSVALLLSLPHAGDAGYWLRAGGAVLALVPLAVIFYRFDFPLRLRGALWVYLALGIAAFGLFDLLATGVLLVLYLGFTVVLWGSVYYHLRIGTPLTNFTRFWRLVLENPDPTSGNFLEQVPKALLLVLLFRHLAGDFTLGAAAGVGAFTLVVGVSALLLHQWLFTWAPASPLTPTRVRNTGGRRASRRVIAVVIDGCRADRLREARTPFLDRLRREGTEFTDMRAVYPARTVTCFSSMLTGAPPKVHGMASNFVPSLGVKCDSIFESLRRQGLKGVMVGIAHLVDAFGERDVKTVSAVTHNDEIDAALAARGRQALTDEDPDLLVLQLLSVDQTGHSRGSYNREYLEKIEETDREIERFLGWCRDNGYLDDATVIITSDHGQGRGIGGHGHLTESERNVPCILWGAGIEAGVVREEPRLLMDIAPTVSYLLGALPPEQSVGQTLVAPGHEAEAGEGPIAVIIPAYNESENLPETLAAVPRDRVPDAHVIVVDDGSTDGTGEAARLAGAETVIRHDGNRGLGAALRTGLAAAREMDARAAVYVDADGEYDPAEIPLLLAPVERGEADYVLGSRYLGQRDGQPLIRHAANRLFTGLLCVAAGRRITDGQTGFRAFSRRALDVAEIVHDYNYAQVLTLDLLRKRMRLVEAPITWRPRRHGNSFISPRYLWKVPLGMAREMLST